MPILTHISPGTAKPIKATTDYTVNGVVQPTLKYTRAATFALGTPGQTIYLGLQKPLGVGSAVSSSNYDILLNDVNPSFTEGLATEYNDVDLGSTYWDVSANPTKLILGAETT